VVFLAFRGVSWCPLSYSPYTSEFLSVVFRGVLDLDLNWCKHGDSQQVFIIMWQNTTESCQILVLVPM
jgi:hypothetical protein